MKRTEILPYAEELLTVLAPACDRLEIAGSIRREKEEVKDIEIVAIPKWDMDMFGERVETSEMLDAVIRYAVDAGFFAWQINEHGNLAGNGPHYKKLLIPKLGAKIDLFLCSPENWGNQLAIRTGSDKFSEWFVTDRRFGGGKPDRLKHTGGYLWSFRHDGIFPVGICIRGVWSGAIGERIPTRIDCPEEADFFAALDLPVLHPRERNEQGITKLLALMDLTEVERMVLGVTRQIR